MIVPARNEAARIGELLRSLQVQTVSPGEVIVANDDSTDETASVAAAWGAQVLQVPPRPENWTGKSWACDRGAAAATGDVLLFLDADVVLGPQALERLLSACAHSAGGVVSVQPYHRIVKPYESYSALFNLQVIASIGIGHGARGLFGPCIMIAAADYERCGGHAAIRESVVDDIALGAVCRTNGVAIHTYLGGTTMWFRMYEEGPRQMLTGWTKNFLQGAGATPRHILFAQAMWIVGAATAAVQLPLAAAGLAIGIVPLHLAVGAYLGYVVLLTAVLPRHGNFGVSTAFLFPLHVAFFAVVTVSALWIRIRGGSVSWRGREVTPHPRGDVERRV